MIAKASLNGRGSVLFHADSGLAGEPASTAIREMLEDVDTPIPEATVHDDVIGGEAAGLVLPTRSSRPRACLPRGGARRSLDSVAVDSDPAREQNACLQRPPDLRQPGVLGRGAVAGELVHFVVI
jgi:hypothetical protein